MKFSSTALAIGAIASSSALTVSAQAVDTPLGLLSYVEGFLSTGCKSSLQSLVKGDLAQCLELPYLLPVINNTNTSIIPDLDTYFKAICASPACTNATLANATSTLLTGCSTELNAFGVSNSTVEIIFGAYDTARDVVCLSTSTPFNSTKPSSGAVATPLNSTTPISSNSTNSTNSSSTLCPTSLLYELESYLGSPLTNAYIDTLLLGGNSTAYTLVRDLVSNTTVLQKAVCNDCVQGSLDIVLRDYPVLETLNFTIVNTSYTVDTLYEGLCNVTVGSNATLPASLNETAFNTTLPHAANTTSHNITAPVAQVAARKRFMRWD